MHLRCVHCGSEQHGPRVYGFSHGNGPCPSCRWRHAPIFTDINRYRAALKEAGHARDQPEHGDR